MITRLSFFTVLIVVLTSCGPKTAGPVPVFDVDGSYPSRNLTLQEIATVEYIPLEMKDDFLIGEYPDIHYLDDDVIVTGTRTTIMFFDRKTGKGIRSFSREGRGPGEYRGIGSVTVDMKGGEIFVTENWRSSLSGGKGPMHVYDLHGKHSRTIEVPNLGFENYMHVYDEDYLFVYNEPDYDADTQEPEPYRLISRTDTSCVHLPLRFPNRTHMDVRVETENGYSVSNRAGTTVLKTAEGYIFSEPGLDTIYRWNRNSGKLTPLMTRTPAFGSMEYPVALSVMAESSDYLFLDFGERRHYDYRRGERSKYSFSGLYYDKNDGLFYDGAVMNGDITEQGYFPLDNITSNPVRYPPGVLVNVMQAVRLVTRHEEGKLTGPLAEIAAGLKEDDNPVVVIATLK